VEVWPEFPTMGAASKMVLKNKQSASLLVYFINLIAFCVLVKLNYAPMLGMLA